MGITLPGRLDHRFTTRRPADSTRAANRGNSLGEKMEDLMPEVGEQELSDAELLFLLKNIQAGKNAEGELGAANALLEDFALELLRRRLSKKVAFIQLLKPALPN